MAARRILPTPPTADPNGEPEAPEGPDAGDLDILAEADQDWSWYVYRQLTTDEARVMKQPRALIARLFGPVDIFAFQAEHGGGTFEFWGTIKGQRGLADKLIVPLAGPIKPLHPPATVATPNNAPQAVAESPTEAAVLRQLERMTDRLERLERTPPPAVAAPTSIKDLAETLVMLESLNQRRTPPPANPDKEIVATMLGILQQGIDIGQQREPAAAPEGEGAVPWGTIVEKAMPLVTRILDRDADRRRRAAGAPPPPVSSAQVIDDPPPPGTPTVDDLPTARMMTAVDALARAIARKVEPDGFADSLRDILTETELAIMVNTPPEQVVAMLVERSGPHRELLSTDGAKAYIGAVLAALHDDSSDDSDSSAVPPPA